MRQDLAGMLPWLSGGAGAREHFARVAAWKGGGGEGLAL